MTHDTPHIRVALAGLGTVGSALLQLLEEDQDRYRQLLGRGLRVTAVLDRSIDQKEERLAGLDVQRFSQVEPFLQVQADVIVELIGGRQPALQIIQHFLGRGVPVVTGNKLLLAAEGPRLLELARDHGASIGFEASVAGGVPLVRCLQDSLLADHIVALRGILNGTCNYILTLMSDGETDFPRALEQAQNLGFAEADPELDVSGADAADKLSILAGMAFGKWPERSRIPTQGITALDPVDFGFAQRLDASIRLLGVAQREAAGFRLRVAPFLVDRRVALAAVSGPLNAVEVTGRRLGAVFFSGRGAGGQATAVSVAADLVAIGRQLMGGGAAARQPFASQQMVRPNASGDDSYPFYLRFFVQDQTGIIARVASLLAQEGINLDAVYQEPWQDRDHLPFALSTDPAPYAAITRAVEQIARLPFNRIPPVLLPILRPQQPATEGP